jgi:hypothetical protein
MAIAIRQSKTLTSPSGALTSPQSIVFDSAVLAGSLLVVIGAGLRKADYLFSHLTAISDTQSNAWQSIVTQGSGSAASVWMSYAMNATAGATTLSLSFTGSDNSLGVCAFEVTGALTSGALDQTKAATTAASGIATNTSSTGASAALAQANNVVFLIAAGALGLPTNPATWTSYLTTQNGANLIGCQISAKATAATDAITGTVQHDDATAERNALLAVFKEGAAAATKRYKFQFDAGTFTSSDTGITGYVWRNASPVTGTAQEYTSLTGASAVAGDLYIASIPAAAAVSDTVLGIFSNGTDTSGLVSGTVEEV